MPCCRFRLLSVVLATFAGAISACGKSNLSVAAAANLVYALETLNTEFKRTSPDITVETTTGASGNLFAQLRQGAPFDVFLSADRDYPRQVVAAGLGDAKSART